MDNIVNVLKKHISDHQPNYGDGETILTLLYEVYSEYNRMEDAKIKVDFEELYRLMNGMPLRDMDKIIYPVCSLCRDHEKAGFIEGIKLGIRLKLELTE